MANSKEYVVHGATLKCTMGSKTATLKVSNNRKYTMNGKKVATIMDFAPGVNIFPPVGAFGICKPYSAVPPPGNMCTPILIGPWKMPYMPENIGVLRPLLGNSMITCGRGGVVTISKTGQNTQSPVIVKDHVDKCPICGNDHPVRENKNVGVSTGSSSTLGRRLNRKKSPFHYVVELVSKSERKYLAGSLQAHHLVLASTCNKDDKAKEAIEYYGYDINHKKNGVLLPGFMDLACWLNMPVHNTNHDDGEIIINGEKEDDSYEDYVIRRALNIIKPYKNQRICQNNDGLINELNAFSKKVHDNVMSFVWTISKDGKDYAPGHLVGCGNVPPNINSHKAKKGDCACGRNHAIEKLAKIKEKIEQVQQAISKF